MILRICALIAYIAAHSLANEVSVTKKWSCNELERCVPFVGQKSLEEGSIYETQNICRLSCGRYGSLWPRPTGASLISHGRVNFDPKNIQFDVYPIGREAMAFLNNVTTIFWNNVVKECKKNCNYPGQTRVFIKIRASSRDLTLDWDTDESSSMIITTSGIDSHVDIVAPTVYGVRHALESLSQLITASADSSICPPPTVQVPSINNTILINYNIDVLIRESRHGNYATIRSRSCFRSGLVMVDTARIADRPTYKHRGILMDTARNYIPVDVILSTLDGMATSKMNVFHWHATDSHSFPLEIRQVPQLQRFGAYSPDAVYTRKDIKNIVNYAKQRGIRVLVEIDSPGHAGNGWQWGPLGGLGDLAVCVNQQPWRSLCIQPPCGQMNPVNENLYSVLKMLYEDIAELVADEETLHMGGDELFLPCWNSSKEIVNRLKERGLDTSTASFLTLWSEFHNRTQKIWSDIKHESTKVILWSSQLTDPKVIERYLPADKFIIQTWVESSEPLITSLLMRQYKIIVSTKDAWYLDHGFWGTTQYYNWKRVYDNRLSRDVGVLGGEVCMWSEYVDENSIEGRIWPRAGAAAERLWADPASNALLAESRFNRFRERLIARGITPDAVTPKWCTLNEGNCL